MNANKDTLGTKRTQPAQDLEETRGLHDTHRSTVSLEDSYKPFYEATDGPEEEQFTA